MSIYCRQAAYTTYSPRGRLVLLCLCSLSPGVLKRAPGEDLFALLLLVLMFQGHQEGFYVFCSLSPGVGSRGRLVYVVCPLVHPEKGPRGRLVFLYVVCLPVL